MIAWPFHVVARTSYANRDGFREELNASSDPPNSHGAHHRSCSGLRALASTRPTSCLNRETDMRRGRTRATAITMALAGLACQLAMSFTAVHANDSSAAMAA